MTPLAALKVAVVGPTHPYKGGVAAHTTSLAHELAEAGHDVTLVSWSHLYPSKLYPGEQAVPGGAPDVEPFPRTVRALSWARPDTWVRTGRRLRGFDVVIVVHVIPAVVPAHLALLRAAGAGRRGAGATGASARKAAPRTVVIAHNVLPHETHLGDRELMEQLFERVDAVLVHSDEQARLAHELHAPRVSVTDLPPHLPGGPPVDRADHDGPPRLLALGMVRDYKGVDLLMEALAKVPGPTLTVAGEMWGSSGERVKELARDPRLRDRVAVHGGYVPADRLAALLASHDVLALTYRSATASQNALLGRHHGLAVLASDVGTFGAQVRDGVDGLLVPAGDQEALVAALERLAEPGYADELRARVRPPDLSGPWANYLGTLEALASVEPATLPDDDTDAVVPDVGTAPGPPVGHGPTAVVGHLRHRVTSAVRGLVAASRPEVELARGDLPEWIRASDILADGHDADEAKAFAKALGLPRCGDGIAAWAALGALAAIVRVKDDGRRSAVIVDESGTRSPLSRWARSIGFAPVELELTGHRSSVEVLDVDTASLDVIVRLHPGGCDADDIDEAMSQASWALRSGGLLCVTLPIGPSSAEGALGPADVRGVLARSHDLGFVLVGDLDGDITGRMRQASGTSTRTDTAYGLLRLTLRRR